ncbi:MAG: nucleotidyltransferase domain-containing protein [Methanomassiliicoccales archaeon]|nr:nucleotidyltransferase domain-containing protein [Methanomassiliicoccales archaeon]
MGFDSEQWISELLARLDEAFGDRILYVGHTGSYARGEATEESDIDVNIVLDALTMEDLERYRQIVRSMPHREKACGFVCGADEMRAWPAHELFQFTQGCIVLRGSLDHLVSAPTDRDIEDNVRNLTSSIYHQCCHAYLFEDGLDDAAEGLKDAYRATFFVMQELVFLRDREYVPTKRELLDRLQGEDRAVLEVCTRWNELKEDRRDRPEHYFSLLREWSSRALKSVRTV